MPQETRNPPRPARNPSGPGLMLGDGDYTRLMSLVSATQARLPDAADDLIAEIERAEVVETGAVPDDVVQMGSTVEYQPEEGKARRVTLVYPTEANIDAGKVSVLTPIGTALLGLKVGDRIRWEARNGREQELTIVAVTPPAPEEDRS